MCLSAEIKSFDSIKKFTRGKRGGRLNYRLAFLQIKLPNEKTSFYGYFTY